MQVKLGQLTTLKEGLKPFLGLEMIQGAAYWIGRFFDKIVSEEISYIKSVSRIERKYGYYIYTTENKEYRFRYDQSNPDKSDHLTGKWIDSEEKECEDLQVSEKDVRWKANSPADFEAHSKELDNLNDQMIDIPFEPLDVSQLLDPDGKPLRLKPSIFIPVQVLFKLDK